jgi:hypothetical protein
MNVLLYHLMPIHHWKWLTATLLSNVPHDAIMVHVSLVDPSESTAIEDFLRSIPKLSTIEFSYNHPEFGECQGFHKLRDSAGDISIDIVTYFHSKGVTKPGNRNIADWVEFMRYFHIDLFQLANEAFDAGFKLYGVNKRVFASDGPGFGPFMFSKFHYSGNFVTASLKSLPLFFDTPIDKDYYGVEGFWGKLCSEGEAYSAFDTVIDHYHQPFPARLYKDLKVRFIGHCERDR